MIFDLSMSKKAGLKYSSEVAIIGAGLAGLVTAHELLDYGKHVLLIDRDSAENLGGLAKKSFGGVMLIDTPYQRKLGIKDSAELALSDWFSYAEFSKDDYWPRQWAQTYCERANDLIFDYLKKNEIKFLPLVNWPERGLFKPGNSVPRWHIAWGTGKGIIDAIAQSLFSHKNIDKLTILYEHKVTGFIHKQGSVTGCRGELEDGSEKFEVKAENTVIASGGICGGNLSMVRKHWYNGWPSPPRRMVNGGHKFGDGMLHKAAARIGANVTHLDRHWHYAAGIHHPHPEVPRHGLSLVPPRGALWLNAYGERIGPMPLVGYTDTRFLVDQILRQPGQFSWQVMNYKIAIKELAVSGSEYMTAFREKKKLKMITSVLFGNKELVNRLIKENEDIVTADTLAGLVEKMNEIETAYQVDYGTLKQAVETYDNAVERGKPFINDEQLRRNHASRTYRGDRIRMTDFQKIDDAKAGPLIAIREFILSRKSLGGIQTDLESKALNESGSVIKGLYAAGEAAGFGGGGIHGIRSLEGTFLGSCILTGRIAARSICNKPV